MKKSLTAVLVAVLISSIVGVAILAIGGAAYFNKNGTHVSNAQAAGGAELNTSRPALQADQLQQLVSQYQDREQQYKQREQQLQQQLADANTQIQNDEKLVQQTRMLIQALQQRGIIQITNDGRIFINQ
jgi:hypothetical protein